MFVVRRDHNRGVEKWKSKDVAYNLQAQGRQTVLPAWVRIDPLFDARDVFAAANDDVFQAIAYLDKYRMRSIGPHVCFLARQTKLEAKGLGFVTDS